MTTKPPKKGLSEPEAAYRHEDNVLSEAEMEAWFERNKDALKASIEEAQAQIERGEWYTLEEVMAELKAQAKRRQARKA
jgi:hypothetical protein